MIANDKEIIVVRSAYREYCNQHMLSAFVALCYYDLAQGHKNVEYSLCRLIRRPEHLTVELESKIYLTIMAEIRECY
jgi:hypothetical protein